MIGCSVFLRGDEAALLGLARHLRIPERNMFWYGQIAADYSFYDRQENSMKCATVGGDFNYMCDVDLFDLPQDMLIDRLQAISRDGLVLAIPDDTSESPLDCLMFTNGSTKKIVLLKDDLLEVVRIFDEEERAK